MDIPYGDVDRIAKMVPDHAEYQLEQSAHRFSTLQQAYDSEPQVQN